MTDQDLPAQEGAAPIREYIAILRLRKWSVMLITALTLGGALFISLRQTPLYESSSRVLVKPLALSPSEPGAVVQANLETEAGLAASVPVARGVVEELGLPDSPQSLLGPLSVEVVATSDFLIISYRHREPVEAQRLAQTFATAYLDFRRDQAVNDVLAAGEAVQERIESLQERIRELEVEIPSAQSPSEQVTLQGERDVLVSQLAVLQQKLFDLTPSNLSVGQVVEPATLPSAPVNPNYPVNLALGLLLGLGLGVGLAFLRERLDDRLRGREDMESQAGAPVLAVIPKVGSWKKKGRTPVVTLSEPKSAASEAYRTLRTSLSFQAGEQGFKTILITSPHPDEGKTATVANLAVSLAQAGKRVVAISADLRKPRLHRFLGETSNGRGLTNVLAGESSPVESLARPGIESLRLLGSGPVPGNPSELLGSDRMGQLLDELREVSDFVLIDSAPVLAVSDALTVAPLVDAVLLIADAQKTTRGSIAHARQQLDQVNANVVGAVLNNFDPSKGRHPYYYQYYYVYRYEQPEKGRRGRRARRDDAGSQARSTWSG